MKSKFHVHLMNLKMNLNLQCQMMLYLKDSKITNSKKTKKKNTTKKGRKKRMKALLATKNLLATVSHKKEHVLSLKWFDQSGKTA